MSNESAKVEGGYSTEETLLAVKDSIDNITINEVATAADGGALPAVVKVIAGYDGANVQAIKTDVAGELQIDVLSSALPTGAASESTLSGISNKLPDLGQTNAAGSVSVVLASDQPTVPVSGPLTDGELRASAVPVSGPLTDAQLRVSAVPVSLASVPLASGAATSAKQDLGNLYVATVNGKFPAATGATQAFGDLVGSGNPVANETFTITTLISGVKVFTFVSGAPSNSQQVQIDANPFNTVTNMISAINSTFPAAEVLATTPVAGTIRITAGSFYPGSVGNALTLVESATNITTANVGVGGVFTGGVDGTTAVATSAKQDTGNTSVASIDTKTPALVSGRVPVDPSGVTSPVSAASLPLPAGAATETTLSSVSTNTGRSPRNANATDSAGATVGTSAVSESAPADAVGFLLSTDPTNTGSVFYRLGGTATITAGHALEASRDTGYIPLAVTISLIADTAAQKYTLTWVRR